ncbi:M28 family peptidase [Poritiphilus flavus]|uniref:M28 family peptidase n=1 Tax=Poritiphilus flavus TaxID=2697053 RepID=A0A6L9EH34_9FLAO|nr:M28 family peptidase [Poritiphilus flavus]NAS13963.1 M28 family peptidase [Poritiphilus flavus]
MTSIAKKALICIAIVLPLAGGAQLREKFQAHATYLASDELKGRGTGSEGIRLAAKYIATQFKEIGLEPGLEKSYYQEFPFPEQQQPEANIVGVIKGAATTKKSIVFTAHYDAYGVIKKEEQNDSIYNGALDNAIGVAALIEIARLFAEQEAPECHLVFVATAAEEFGAYGSKFYVENPVFPIEDIIICLNIDGFNVSGVREDYFVFPKRGVDYVDQIEAIAKPLGWVYKSPGWEDQLNTSFDTASFLQRSVPALTLWTGDQLKGGKTAEPIPFGKIHSPEDEITALWNWEGVEDHCLLYKAIADYFLNNPSDIKVTEPSLFMEK